MIDRIKTIVKQNVSFSNSVAAEHRVYSVALVNSAVLFVIITHTLIITESSPH